MYCFYAQDKGYKIVHDRTPDRDIFFILLQYIDRLAGLTVRYWESQKTDQYDRDRSIHTEYRAALPATLQVLYKGKGHILPGIILMLNSAWKTR